MINKQHVGYSAAFSRRQFVTGVAAGSALLGLGFPVAVKSARSAAPELHGRSFNLDIGYKEVNFTGRNRLATTVNGSVPAPILRWREGDEVTLRVTNNLAHDSSIHWHGLILPAGMDGVPGISFGGIRPRRFIHLPVSRPPERHVLVSQPLGIPGADRDVWRHRYRAERPGPRSIRS